MGELVDRLTIVALKISYNKELRSQYISEMSDILDDINWLLTNKVGKDKINGNFIKYVVFLAQFNGMIWHNESASREGDQNGENLIFTHKINGARCRMKDMISVFSKERIDPKIDALGEDVSEWEPTW